MGYRQDMFRQVRLDVTTIFFRVQNLMALDCWVIAGTWEIIEVMMDDTLVLFGGRRGWLFGRVQSLRMFHCQGIDRICLGIYLGYDIYRRGYIFFRVQTLIVLDFIIVELEVTTIPFTIQSLMMLHYRIIKQADFLGLRLQAPPNFPNLKYFKNEPSS